MTQTIQVLSQQLDPAVPALLAGHVTVNGATVGTERSMMLGQDHVLLASNIAQPQLDYVALGHIHKHQVLRRESPMVVYSGSLERVDFSEEGDDKGFCVIDLDPAAPQGRRLVDFQFHRVHARPFVTVDAVVPTGDPDPTATVIRAIGRKDIAGAVVRVRITLAGELDTQGHARPIFGTPCKRRTTWQPSRGKRRKQTGGPGWTPSPPTICNRCRRCGCTWKAGA